MVEAIGSKAITASDLRVAPVTRAVAAAPAAPVATGGAALAGVSRPLAAPPPVDTDRVATIKKAIADGRFPITPATIADRLEALALALEESRPGA